MLFSIQASNPSYIKNIDSKDENLSDVIENIFPLLTENAILMWNHIPIPLSYKYDISYMITDILTLINKLRINENGEIIIHWLPDTFRSDWEIKWQNQIININSHWDCTVGGLETLLNETPEISLPIKDFVKEWKSILEILIEALKVNRNTHLNTNELNSLLIENEKISDNGILYQNHSFSF